MFTTEHFEGRLQCINGDLVIINIHLLSIFPEEKKFITQLFLNKKNNIYFIHDFKLTLSNGTILTKSSLKDEITSIIDQFYILYKILKLSNSHK